MTTDGFGTLTAGLVERHARRTQRSLDVWRGKEKKQAADDRLAGPKSTKRMRRIPAADQEHYSGPERRVRDVSPVVERRRTVAPRVKVSVRLEQARYLRMRLAAAELSRTHQDLLTSALDRYLDYLRIDSFD